MFNVIDSHFNQYLPNNTTKVSELVAKLGQNVQLPNASRNYSIYNQSLVNSIVAQRECALPELENFLKKENEEKKICEALYTLDRMCDAKVVGVGNLYGTLSGFNQTESPNIQVLLAGIYRKTGVPDGFGPLCNMMIKNAQEPPSKFFDPSEEIGGAILEYIKNYSSQNIYSKK